MQRHGAGAARCARCASVVAAWCRSSWCSTPTLTFHPYNKRLPTVIPISDLVEVSMYDQRRPERVRFKCRGRFAAREDMSRRRDEATDAPAGGHRGRAQGAYKCATRRRFMPRGPSRHRRDRRVCSMAYPTQPKPGPPSRRLARSKSGAIVDESRAGVHDDLMRVPGKPLGFLAASTIEYHPARPEAHRSTVLAGQKPQLAAAEARELPVKVSLRHKQQRG